MVNQRTEDAMPKNKSKRKDDQAEKVDYTTRCSVRIENEHTGYSFRFTCYGVSRKEAMLIREEGENFGRILADKLARRGIVLCCDGGPWITSIFHVVEEPIHA
jgi:hypothetical protein